MISSNGPDWRTDHCPYFCRGSFALTEIKLAVWRSLEAVAQIKAQHDLASLEARGEATGPERELFRRLEIVRDMAMHLPLVPEWTIQIHERTVAAVRSGDLEAVERVMDDHVGKLELTWEEETARALVRPLPDFLLPASARKPSAA